MVTPQASPPSGEGGVSVLKEVVVAVRGTRIEYVGDAQHLPESFQQAERVDARKQIVMPGFVNTHSHAAMTLLRGYADDLPLMEWLQKKIWPVESRLTGEDVYWGTLLAIGEQIRSGITTFADIYFFTESVLRAVDISGIRAQVCRGLLPLVEDGDRALAESIALFEQWDGHDDRRITMGLAPHAPYSCPDAFIREVVEAAARLEAPIHIHLAETEEEVRNFRTTRGMTPIEWAVQLHLAEHPLVAAHCVHLSDADVELLAKHRIAVAHNPITNLKLASGIARVKDMREAGVLVGLGTDGAGSSNHLNFFEEMRLSSWLAKVTSNDARSLEAAAVFRMATVDGAQALGYPDVGRIAEGYRADLVVLDTDSFHMIPHHNILSLIVYSAQTKDVRDVFVHGRPLMRNRKLLTLDEAEVRRQAMQRGLQLVRKV